jgi:predicted hydrocarbon binding protein
LILVDESSDFTFGQTDELNICWVTQGMLEEVLQWGSNQEYDVEEITCRATGGEVCKFQIRPL